MSRALRVAALVIALCAPFAAGPALARAQSATPTTDHTEEVAYRFVEAMNTIFANGDASTLDSVVAPDYVDRTPSDTRTGGMATPDLAGLKATFEAVHETFPEATVKVDDAIVDGDMAALLITFNGLRGPGTVVDGVLVLRVADGHVVESWNYERGGEAPLQPAFEGTPQG
jgi:ketosteroid isomerase-like protein